MMVRAYVATVMRDLEGSPNLDHYAPKINLVNSRISKPLGELEMLRIACDDLSEIICINDAKINLFSVHRLFGDRNACI
jgi:hypothetical protein